MTWNKEVEEGRLKNAFGFLDIACAIWVMLFAKLDDAGNVRREGGKDLTLKAVAMALNGMFSSRQLGKRL